ncbi:MAG: AAA domain-containing protein [Candidatus Pacebacteria bacterium]|nr:AAA domain-containing protein [Candidatus Paceibacterota bacterium]
MKRPLSGNSEVEQPERKKECAQNQADEMGKENGNGVEKITIMGQPQEQTLDKDSHIDLVVKSDLKSGTRPAISGDRLRFLVTCKGVVEGRLVFKLKLQQIEAQDSRENNGVFDKQREFTVSTKYKWQYEEILEGDLVKVLGNFNPETYECNMDEYQDDIYNGYMILEPDIYLTATLIAATVECPRRGFFELAFPKAEPRIFYPLLLGTMVHEMFDQCLVHQDDLSNLDNEIIEACLAEHFLEVHLAGKDEEEVRLDLKDYMTQLRKIVQENMVEKKPLEGTDYSVLDIVAIEQKMFSRRFAIKGQTDATVEVQRKSTGEKRIAAIELKSGEDRGQIAHTLQASLYALLLHDLGCAVSDEQFLVYIKFARVKAVKITKTDYTDIIQKRNKLVRMQQQIYRGQLTTPKMCKSSMACKFCPHAQFCYLYCKSYGEVSDIEDLPSLEQLGPVMEIKDSITPSVVDYFKKWNYLITLEQNTSERRNGSPGSAAGIVEYSSKRKYAEAEVTEESRMQPTEIRRAGRELLLTLRKSGDLDLDASVGTFVDIFCSDTPLFTLGRGRIIARETALDESKQRCSLVSLSITDTTMVDIHCKRMALEELKNKMWSIRCSTQSNVVYAFMRWAILGLCTNLAHQQLRELIIDLRKPAIPRLTYTLEKVAQTYGPAIKGLNPEQVHAVLKALNCEEYQLVMGVHGSGKSTTIAALLEILSGEGAKVFVTANSHTSLDNTLHKLVARGVQFLRVAPNKEVVHPNIQPYLTTYVQAQHESTKAYLESISKVCIFAATPFGLTTDLLRSMTFDYCIIEESSQMLEPVCLGPLLCCKKFVLFGDGGQHNPMVGNAVARLGGLGTSLFDRLARANPEHVTKMCKQYVMNAGIMSLMNEVVYAGIMECGQPRTRLNRLALPNRKITYHFSFI